MPKFRLPKEKFGDDIGEQVSEKHDYKRNIFNQIDRITIMGTHGNRMGFISGIKQLRFLLIPYIARNENYRIKEKKINNEYKIEIKKASTDRKKKLLGFVKQKKVYIQLQLLIGTMGFLPELEGEFREGEDEKEKEVDLYDG